MSSAEKFAATQMTAMTDLNRLHSAERISAACSKYAAAVELYASSSLSVREIAKTTGLSPKALSSHLSRHHRPLLYSRSGIDPHEDKQTDPSPHHDGGFVRCGRVGCPGGAGGIREAVSGESLCLRRHQPDKGDGLFRICYESV